MAPMKRLFLFLISLISLISLITPSPVSAEETTRLIVKYRSQVSESTQLELHNRIRATSLRLRAPKSRLLRIPSSRKIETINALKQSDLIEYVEEDQLLEPLEVPSDTEYPKQWALTKINAPSAWDVSKSSSNVQIAILDSGVTNTHPDLQGKVILETNFTDDSYIEDRFGHGTHVAGIAAAATNNNLGVAGVGHDAQVISGKVLNRYGRGYYSWLVNALYWAADNGAEVVNMSIGGTYSSQALQDAINYAWSRGVVLVAAAGNSNSSKLVFPAAYEHVIAVAATDKTDQKAYFSNYGAWVDVAAPGVSILSLDDDGDYVTQTGTSMASPHVSGLAALLWGSGWGSNNQAVTDRIFSTASPIAGTSTYWQYGRIDAGAALGLTPSLEPTPTPSALPSIAPSPSPSPEPSPSPTSSPSPSPSPSPLSSPQPSAEVGRPSRWCQRFPFIRHCQ